MRRLVPALAFLLLASAGASAQSTERIFNLELGTPVADLPTDQWVYPFCGTNGGPRSLELTSFADFARCRAEPANGLHEVWFIYDDEWEYIARAYRDPVEIGRFSANIFYEQPIITSLLIDDAGLVQGYRMTTDPRAPTEIRELAYNLHNILKSQFSGAEWRCEDLPRVTGEEPVEGVFFKQDCVMVTGDRFIRLEGRLLQRPGQFRFAEITAGEFESTARLEVYNLDAVKDAPCCQAFAQP
ncbi:MAG: hypothetical protein IT535_14945 [Bauldia sp.]|nr:hypothetical protein [Bauldia sp.]